MDANISKEVNEAMTTTPPDIPRQETTESVETLLEEMIKSARPLSPPFVNEAKIPSFLFDKEKPKRHRSSLFPLWLSLAVLGGIFLGTIFVFYWGRISRNDPLLFAYDDIKEIYNKIFPATPPGEIIEPLDKKTNNIVKGS